MPAIMESCNLIIKASAGAVPITSTFPKFSLRGEMINLKISGDQYRQIAEVMHTAIALRVRELLRAITCSIKLIS